MLEIFSLNQQLLHAFNCVNELLFFPAEIQFVSNMKVKSFQQRTLEKSRAAIIWFPRWYFLQWEFYCGCFFFVAYFLGVLHLAVVKFRSRSFQDCNKHRHRLPIHEITSKFAFYLYPVVFSLCHSPATWIVCWGRVSKLHFVCVWLRTENEKSFGAKCWLFDMRSMLRTWHLCAKFSDFHSSSSINIVASCIISIPFKLQQSSFIVSHLFGNKHVSHSPWRPRNPMVYKNPTDFKRKSVIIKFNVFYSSHFIFRAWVGDMSADVELVKNVHATQTP